MDGGEPNGVDDSSQTIPVTTQSEPTQTASQSQSQGPQTTQPSQGGTTTASGAAGSSQQPQQQAQQQQQMQQPSSPTSASSAPRPRDARMIELLLTSQGVTAYEARVPLMLMDLAYRHTSALLGDALFLGADPYTSQAGARASAQSGHTASLVSATDATISANAVRLAITSRQNAQLRSAAATAQGGLSKEWLLDLARERNKVALPRVPANEWAARLPSEKFVLTGQSWGLGELYDAESAGDSDEDDNDDDEDDVEMEDVLARAPGGAAGDAMEEGGEDPEGGTVDDVFGDDMDEDLEEE